MDPGTIHLMVWYHDPGWIHGILSLVMTSITDGTEHRGLRTAQPVVWSTTSNTSAYWRYGIASTILDA